MSVAADGTGANGAAGTVSMGGGRVAFSATATNLVPGDTNGVSDVFVAAPAAADVRTARLSTAAAGGRLAADRATGGFTCVYVKDPRTGALRRVPDTQLHTHRPVISAKGHSVGYSSGNRCPMPYVYDRVTGETQRLWPAQPPQDTLAYVRDLRTGRTQPVGALVPGDTNGVADVFIGVLRHGHGQSR